MLDRYLIGDHVGPSPEADVPLLKFSHSENRMGGAANVAANLKSLGLQPIIVSVLGQDPDGDILAEMCKKEFPESHFFMDTDRPTTVKERMVDTDFKQLMRLDNETTDPIDSNMESAIISSMDKLITDNEIEGLVIQDYNKGLLTPGLIDYVIKCSQRMKLPLFVDPKYDNFLRLSNCTLFKPNLKELKRISGSSEKDDLLTIKSQIEALGLRSKLVFVTLADKGIFLWDRETDMAEIISGHKVVDADVSGAGDTVLSVLIRGYLLNLDLIELAKQANNAGAAVCGRSGISRVSLLDLS